MKSTYPVLLAIICLLVNIKTDAQKFHLVKDLNQSTSSNPQNYFYTGTGKFSGNYAVLNGIVYFNATDSLHGSELWRSDGTGAGTYLVKDIRSGMQSSDVTSITVFKDAIYFIANDSIHGLELWKSDGTDAGTNMVKDINPGSADGFPYYLMNNDNKDLFFGISHGGSVCQLWKSDGTETGTIMIKDLTGVGQYIKSPIIVNSKICFFLNVGLPDELWVTNETSDGTYKIASLTAPLGFRNTIASNGSTLYFADLNSNLWKSDGTENGTITFANISNTSDFILYNNSLVFSVGDQNLFVSDGTSNGTYSIFYAENLGSKAIVNNKIFFFSYTAGGYYDLFKTNATSQGTTLVKHLDTGYLPFGNTLSAIGNKLYFSAYTANNGTELWKSDGTRIGTYQVKDIYKGAGSSSPEAFSLVNKNVLFVGNDGIHGNELWSSDTATDETFFVKDINLNNTDNAVPTQLTVYNDSIYFAARNDAYGTELWKTNGTEQGTVLVKDIEKASLSGIESFYLFSPFFQSGNNLYFTGTTQQYGGELWTTNGKAASTKMVGDLSPGPGSSNFLFDYSALFHEVADVNDKLFFVNSIGAGNELCTTTGNNGIAVITSSTYQINNLTSFNGKLFYKVGTFNLPQLWLTDGTSQNNKQIITAKPDNRASLFTYKQKLFFGSNDGVMWETDGTEANTKQFKQIRPDPFYDEGVGINTFYSEGFSNANIVLNNELYFAAFDSAHGSELWKTDGTSSGTVLVKDVNAGVDDGQLGSFIKIGDVFYFLANDGIHGRELWKSDGTEAGTVLVKDVTSGANSSSIISLTQYKNTLLFLLTIGEDSYKLWQSDGSEAGTQEVDDPSLNNVQIISPLRVLKNHIYFVATTKQYGSELWVGSLDGVLATQLFNFTGKKINNSDVQLNWTTVNEQDLNYFNVQRSTDGIYFSTISKVLAKDISNAQTSYQYLDKNINSFNTNDVYYKLEEVDKDGKSTFSNIVLIKLLQNDMNVSIKPNPVVSTFEIQVTNAKFPQQVQVQIFNVTGKNTFTENEFFGSSNKVLDFNASSWAPGVYITRLTFADGTKKEIKIVKAR